MDAIKNLNEITVRGMELRVSMARYNKGGSPAIYPNSGLKNQAAGFRKIIKPSFRDHRNYAEVLTGKEQMTLKKDGGNNVIPINFTLDAAENRDMVSNLEYAIIAEKTEVINLTQVAAEVYTCSNSVKGMYSLSPTKMLIVFECEKEAIKL